MVPSVMAFQTFCHLDADEEPQLKLPEPLMLGQDYSESEVGNWAWAQVDNRKGYRQDDFSIIGGGLLPVHHGSGVHHLL